MAAITNLVLNNGTSDVTFIPASKSGTTTVWTAPADSVQLQPRLNLDCKATVSSSDNRKVKFVLALPFVDTNINDVKAYKTIYFNVECVLPRVATSANILALRQMCSNACLNAVLLDAIDNGNNPY